MKMDRIADRTCWDIPGLLTRKRGNVISIEPDGMISIPEDPSSYEKHSKDWHRLDSLLTRLDLGRCYAAQGISYADTMFVREIFNHPDAFGEDVIRRLGSMGQDTCLMLYAFTHAADYALAFMTGYPFRGVNWIRKLFNGIDSRLHPLYACLKMTPETVAWFVREAFSSRDMDAEYITLTAILAVVDTDVDANLNWIDVSGMENYSAMFMRLDPEKFTDDLNFTWKFNGDISLWDVSGAREMRNMFSGSVFRGDISGWQIPADCDTEGMFENSSVPMENRPASAAMLDESLLNALTRKRNAGISIEPGKGISVAAERDAYEKHSKDFYEVTDFLERLDPERLTIEDGKTALRIYGDIDAFPDDIRLAIEEKMDSLRLAVRRTLTPCLADLVRNRAFFDRDLARGVLPGDFYEDRISEMVAIVRDWTDKVTSVDHPLYAAFVITDREVLDGIVEDWHRFYPESNGNLNWIDISGIDNLSGLFNRDKHQWDISLWDVSHVRNMSQMFRMSSFDGDISGWRPDSVEDMSQMFEDSEFGGDISGWRFPGCRNFVRMFANSPFDGDISGWEFPAAEKMMAMFLDTDFSGDISGWEIPERCDVRHMMTGSEVPEERWPQATKSQRIHMR